MDFMEETSGILYIVATPIGNLEDITLRAMRILREEVKAVFCEDTRQTGKLLSHLGISLPMYSLHSNSPDAKYSRAVDYLRAGNSAAYLTDSGTPGVSDPGSRLVRACRDAGVSIIPVPGPSAFTALLSISGFPGRNVLFLGFLSRKSGKRRKELEMIASHECVGVIYESPNRIRALIKEIAEILPHSNLVIGRELTKLHEEIITGTAQSLADTIESIKEKGEFAVAVYTHEKN